MQRLAGTLTIQTKEGRRGLDRGGLRIGSILAGAKAVGNCNRAELQIWTQQLTRSLVAWRYRQQQREACDRARLAIARNTMFGRSSLGERCK
jgi:hypothetical protein